MATKKPSKAKTSKAAKPAKVAKTPKAKKQKSTRAQPQTMAQKLLRWGFVACIWIGLFIVALLAWYGKDLGKIANAVKPEHERIVRIYARDGVTELASYGHLKGDNVRVEDLPDHVSNAFIAIEDRRFYGHFGIDLIGLTRAMFLNVKAGGIVQGGSTITQQLSKNLFFNPERTLKRKIQEAMLALWIEHKYSKEEILSSYLNHVYFGAGAYGLDAAAHRYFNKKPEDLGLKEAALLAGLVQAPSRLSPSHNPQGAIERMRVVLNAMEDAGFVTPEMIIDAKNVKIVDGKVEGMEFVRDKKESHYFTDWIYRQVQVVGSDVEGNLKVTTTLSPTLQKRVAEIATVELDRNYPKDGEERRPEVAAVLLNPDGAIRAMVGGYDYEKSQFNRATDSVRQAGSSFKPFIYLAAIEQGWRPDNMVSNRRITSGRYRPTNYDGKYSNEVPMREALAKSYNVSSVYLLKDIGVRHVIDLADRVGIDAEVREELSTALGTVDLSLLDLVGAYGTIGQKGRLMTPYGIDKIETEDGGEVLYQYRATYAPRVVSPTHIEELTVMMQDVVQYGTGRRARPGFPVAGKTGTTQDYRDALFLGFSDTYTMGVWMGYDDNTPMKRGTYGGTVPADIWRQSIQAAHGGRAGGPLTRNYHVPLQEIDGEVIMWDGGAKRDDGNSVQNFVRGLFSGGSSRSYSGERQQYEGDRDLNQ